MAVKQYFTRKGGTRLKETEKKKMKRTGSVTVYPPIDWIRRKKERGREGLEGEHA